LRTTDGPRHAATHTRPCASGLVQGGARRQQPPLRRGLDPTTRPAASPSPLPLVATRPSGSRRARRPARGGCLCRQQRAPGHQRAPAGAAFGGGRASCKRVRAAAREDHPPAAAAAKPVPAQRAAPSLRARTAPAGALPRADGPGPLQRAPAGADRPGPAPFGPHVPCFFQGERGLRRTGPVGGLFSTPKERACYLTVPFARAKPRFQEGRARSQAPPKGRARTRTSSRGAPRTVRRRRRRPRPFRPLIFLR
jgi:hypothetical protein